MDDLEAVRETLNGNVEAFSVIVEKYTPVIYRLACRMSERTDYSTEAEDAVQEIFLRAYRSLSSFNVRYRFYTWLYTIALNYLRTLRRKKKIYNLFNIYSYNDSIYSGESIFKREENSPEEALIKKEGGKLCLEALKKLNPREKEVFVLRQIENLSVAETAQILDLPEGTVKNRLHRSKKKLAAVIKSWHWDM